MGDDTIKKRKMGKCTALSVEEKENMVQLSCHNIHCMNSASEGKTQMTRTTSIANGALESAITPRRLPFTDIGSVPCVISNMAALPPKTYGLQDYVVQDATLPTLSTPSPATTLAPHSDSSSLSAAEIKRKRARERYASLSPGRKEARNKKARESRKRKNESSQNADPVASIVANNKTDTSDWWILVSLSLGDPGGDAKSETDQTRLLLGAKFIRQVASDIFNSKSGWRADARRIGY
uniref:Uncharacterized protein n=1 Tax=Oryza nivara TaxID=4536 RepID=A0A0E0GG09_ORYNI